MLEHLLSAPTPPSRVVVVGAAGFVGRAVVGDLQAAGVETVGLSRTDVDLTDADAAERLAGRLQPGDALVFVSALTPDRGRDAGTMLANLAMADAVARAVKDRELSHFVYISSDAVYRDDVAVATERSCREPSSFHGMMHAARELMLTTAVKVPSAILRPSLVYGVDDTHNGYGPNRFRRLAAKGEDIVLFGEGEEMRDHVLIDDLAALVRLVLLRRSVGVLNIATGRSVSFREAAQTTVDCFPNPGKIIGTPRNNPIVHRHFDIADTIKAFPDFRWTPFEDGVRAACARTPTDG